MRVTLLSALAGSFFRDDLDTGTFIPGGSELQIALIAKELRTKGHTTSLILGDFGQESSRVIEGVNLVRGPDRMREAKGLRRVFRYVAYPILLFWAVARTRPELIVDRCANPRLGLLYFFKKVLGARLLFMTAHEWDCDGTYQRRQPTLLGKLYEIGLRGADLVVTQSEEHRALLAKHYGVASQVLGNLAPESHPKFDEGDQGFLWVGRSTSFKEPLRFLELAELLPKQRFTMACAVAPGEESLYQAIKTRSGGLTNVNFLGRVSFEDLPARYRGARALVNTSTQEGLPNAFLQAAMQGRPVFTLGVNPDDLIEKSFVGSDVKDLSRRISSFDREGLNKAGEGLRSRVVERYGVKNQMERLSTIAQSAGLGAL